MRCSWLQLAPILLGNFEFFFPISSLIFGNLVYENMWFGGASHQFCERMSSTPLSAHQFVQMRFFRLVELSPIVKYYKLFSFKCKILENCSQFAYTLFRDSKRFQQCHLSQEEFVLPRREEKGWILSYSYFAPSSKFWFSLSDISPTPRPRLFIYSISEGSWKILTGVQFSTVDSEKS